MLPILSWYVLTLITGIIALPITWRLFSRLPDRGYSLTKHLGVLLAGVTLWLGNAYSFLPNDPGGAWLSIGAVAAAGLVFGRQGILKDPQGIRPLWQWLKSRRSHVIWSEALFLSAFAFWLWVRACDPSIAHTEQPMDLMLLSATHAGSVFPPRDAWLAGYPIGYYYLGYWLLSMLAHITGQSVEVAYNLGQASWFALLLLGSFGLGSNLARLHKQQGIQPRDRIGFPWPAAGLLSAAAVALVGNLEFWVEWLNRNGIATRLVIWLGIAGLPGPRMAPDHWWWWRASRILRDQNLLGRPVEIIDEFPFFSYLLGDNHPHLLSMPFLLLLSGIGLNHIAGMYREHENTQGAYRPGFLSDLRVHLPSITLWAVCVGGLALINTWDLLPAALLVLISLLSQWGKDSGRVAGTLRIVLIQGGLFLGLISALIWPFLVSAQSQVAGIRPTLFSPTRFAHFLLMFGSLLPGLFALLLIAWHESRPTLREGLGSLLWVWGGIAAIFAAGCFWAFGTTSGLSWLREMGPAQPPSSYFQEMARRWTREPVTLLFLSLCLAGAISLLVHRIRLDETAQHRGGHTGEAASLFALSLAVVGCFLLCLPELFYLKDSFGTRMNTIFKLYYQAWLFLALAAAYGCSRALGAGRLGRMLAFPGLLALAAGMAYPVAALPSKIQGSLVRSRTLDGIAHWPEDERAAVRWVRNNIPWNAVLVEGSGASYRPETNRISSATGRSTLLGWPGHEIQWRGEAYPEMAGEREKVLEMIYSSAAEDALQRLLYSWKIDYLFVGPVERQKYRISPEREWQLGEWMPAVFQQGAIKIFRRREADNAP